MGEGRDRTDMQGSESPLEHAWSPVTSEQLTLQPKINKNCEQMDP